MADPHPIDSPTVLAHKRQFAWQILVPFLVVTAIVIAAAVLVVSGAGPGTRTWADVSIIWFVAPMLIFALLSIAVLCLLIYGIAQLLRVTPRYTGKAQNIFAVIAAGTRKTADGTVQPIIWLRQASAVIKLFFNRL